MPTVLTGSLTEKAMLVSLHVSMWSARKLDKQATSEVAVAHGSSETMGRYNKRLLPADAKSYLRLQKIQSEARAFHYKNTLPWNDEGQRVLPVANYWNYVGEMRRLKQDWESAVGDFLFDYDALRDNAKILLNGLWKDSDYPTVDSLTRRFDFGTSISPVPAGSDFRANLNTETLEAIRSDIEASVTKSISEAQGDLYKRLLDAALHMTSRLRGDKTCPCSKCVGKTYSSEKFHDSLIENMREIVELVPRLSLTDDEGLKSAVQTCRGLLVDPDDLRKDEAFKRSVASDAERAADAISAAMQGVFV